MKQVTPWIAAAVVVASAALAVDVIALAGPAQRVERRHERRKELRQEWKTKHEEWRAKREDRRKDEIAKAKAKWGVDVLGRPAVREELRLHADRMARLNRLHDLAEESGDDEAKAKIDKLIVDENARHDARMDFLKTEKP